MNAISRWEDKYGITEQQNRFAEEYIIDLDGKAAAIRAGYSPKGAQVTANRLMNHVGIAARISDLLETRSLRAAVTADQVMRELAQIGLSNIINYEIDDEGYVSLAEGAQSEAMRAIKKLKRTVKYDKDGNKNIETELELWDKVSALRLMGKHLGMFVDITHVQGKVEHEHKQVWEFGDQAIEF